MLSRACILILVSLLLGLTANSYASAVITNEMKKFEWNVYENALDFLAPFNQHLPIHTRLFYCFTGWPGRTSPRFCCWALSIDRALDLSYNPDGSIKAYRFRKYVIHGVWYGYLNPELSLEEAILEERARIRKLNLQRKL